MARIFDIAPNTVKNIVKSDVHFAEKCKQKNEEVETDVLTELAKRGNEVVKLYDLSLERMKSLIATTKDIKGLAMAVGIIIDKSLVNHEVSLKKTQLEKSKKEIELMETKLKLLNGNKEEIDKIAKYLELNKQLAEEASDK